MLSGASGCCGRGGEEAAWHPGGLGEAGEGWGREGGSGLSGAGDTGVWLPLWGSSPHPRVQERLCGSARLAAVALGTLSPGVRRLWAAWQPGPSALCRSGVECGGLEEMGLAWVPRRSLSHLTLSPTGPRTLPPPPGRSQCRTRSCHRAVTVVRSARPRTRGSASRSPYFPGVENGSAGTD